MNTLEKIYLFRGSPVARLARTLSRKYAVCVVDPPRKPARKTPVHAGTSAPSADEAARDAIFGADPPAGPAVWLADPEVDSTPTLRRLARLCPELRLIALVDARTARRAAGREWFACLPGNAPPVFVLRAVASAFASIALARDERTAREELARVERDRQKLSRLGVALSGTHDVGELMKMILTNAREITAADAVSVYLVEATPSRNGQSGAAKRQLRFQLAQDSEGAFPVPEHTLPINESSITGYAALHGEVIALDDAYAVAPYSPYRFDAERDQPPGYRTRSLLAVPMKNLRGEVVGIVRMHKGHDARMRNGNDARMRNGNDARTRDGKGMPMPGESAREAQPFPPSAIRFAESLASQAAVAYENSRLYQDIESLFEGFVGAAVTAIEQRDPTTSGHSTRVSSMTTGLAEIVDRCATGAYRGQRFSPDEMKEIRYAALLHDFGKVGVREEVLVKAKKLYPAQFDVVQGRFDYVHKEFEAHCERQKFRALLDLPREQALRRIAELDDDFRRRIQELDDAFAVIVESNEPTVLLSEQFERLFDVARRTYLDPRGYERPLLTAEETRFLSIPRGSLDSQERRQIESHVVHSFNFLMQIPWTRAIRDVPEIVRAHHEKLNGTGYPFRLKGQEIPVQARMMTICDIFDALSAHDRPYKKAVPADRALAILQDSVSNNELDSELFHLFLEGRVYDLVDHRAPS